MKEALKEKAEMERALELACESKEGCPKSWHYFKECALAPEKRDDNFFCKEIYFVHCEKYDEKAKCWKQYFISKGAEG